MPARDLVLAERSWKPGYGGRRSLILSQEYRGNKPWAGAFVAKFWVWIACFFKGLEPILRNSKKKGSNFDFWAMGRE